MPNIAAPAIVLPGTGKIPAEGNAAAEVTIGDFRQHLAAVKTTATSIAPAKADPMATPAANAANVTGDPIADVAKMTTPAMLKSSTLAETPQINMPANLKTLKPGKKETPLQSGKENAGATAAQAAISPEPTPAGVAVQPTATIAVQTQDAPVITPTDHIVPQPLLDTGAKTSKQQLQPQSFEKPAVKPVPQDSQPIAQAQIAASPTASQTGSTTTNAVPNPTAPAHPQANSHGIASQLANALPPDMAKTGSPAMLHIALKPETLGAVALKIQHNASRNTNVTITASQPETLETLKKDVTTLNQILTNAGIPESGRQIDFRSAPVAPPQSGAAIGNPGNSAMQSGSNGQPPPQNGTAFANSSFKASSTNPASPPMPASASSQGTAGHHGGVDMIA